MNFPSQTAPRTRPLWAILLLTCAPGCFTPLIGETPAAAVSKDSSAAASPQNTSAASPASANLLTDDQWIIALPGKGERGRPTYRWRNASLEQLLVQPVEQQPHLEDFLNEGGIRGANAAILLARAHNPQAAPALVRAVEDPTLKQPIRRAAAEALAALPDEIAVTNLHAALTGIERRVGVTQPAYNADLNAELLSALARRRSADDEPAFTRALDKEELPTRLAALERWAAPGKTPLPAKALELCQDSDARVRRAAIGALIARPDDRTVEELQRASRDPALDVKLTAIEGLGKLNTAGARAALEQVFARDGEMVRAAAVFALVRAGETDIVVRASKDKSWRVHLAAAQNLSELPPGERTLDLARALLAERNAEVQRAVIAAVATWPLAVAGPLWLNSLESGGYLARKDAARLLAEHWPPAKAYSADAPDERRRARLAELRDKWRDEFGEANSLAVPNGEMPRPHKPEITSEETLATTAPAKALERLHSTDLEERRRGAKELAQIAARQPLSPSLIAELTPLVAAEQDATIWQSVFVILAADERPAAAELACAALSHPSADVRRRACEYLAAHGRPENAAALAASLSDEQISVQIAAAKALGRIGSQRDYPALTRLLLANDKTVRVAAAVSLLELGAMEGVAALERLSHDNEEKIRREVVDAMGRSNNREFLPALVRLLDDRASVKLAAVGALEKIVGPAAIRTPDAAAETTDDAARRWKQWYAASQPANPP